MERRVADVMHEGVISCHADTLIPEVAGLMRDHQISAVVIVDVENNLQGIITQTDMVKTFNIKHFERRPWNLLAEHVMTPNVVTTTPDVTLEEASDLMTERRIHRLVVVKKSARTKPIGICSMTDIVRAMAGSSPEDEDVAQG